MAFRSDDIRLRVQLDYGVKFCVKLPEKSTLYELKKLIDNILKRNYHIKLPHYVLRVEGGFEILEMFKIGDILDDNAIVYINPFIVKSKGQSYYNDRPEQEDLSQNCYKKDDFEANNKPTISLSRSGTNAQTQDTIQKPPIKPQDHKITEVSTPKEKPIEIARQRAKRTGISVESANKETDLKTSDAVLGKSDDPLRPDNFKGFVVKKAELIKNSNSKFEEESHFKPLKKRKNDDEDFENF